jgi:hypothetical protein
MRTAFYVMLGYVLLLMAPGAPRTAASSAVAETPTGFAGVALSETEILWSWNDTLGETHYELHDDGHNLIAFIPADTTSVIEGGLAASTTVSRHLHSSEFGFLSPATISIRVTTLGDTVGLVECFMRARMCILDLEAAGLIKDGFSTSLTSKVDTSLEAAIRGNISAAAHMLDALVNQINFSGGDRLTPASLQALNTIIIPRLFACLADASSTAKRSCLISGGRVTDRAPAPNEPGEAYTDPAGQYTATYPPAGVIAAYPVSFQGSTIKVPIIAESGSSSVTIEHDIRVILEHPASVRVSTESVFGQSFVGSGMKASTSGALDMSVTLNDVEKKDGTNYGGPFSYDSSVIPAIIPASRTSATTAVTYELGPGTYKGKIVIKASSFVEWLATIGPEGVEVIGAGVSVDKPRCIVEKAK